MTNRMTFPFFVAASLLCYFLTPKKYRWCMLLAVSYFYYWLIGGLFAIGALSLTVCSVYLAGLWTGRLREENAPRKKRRIPLILCLFFNFGLLAFFKYGGYIFPSAGVLLIPGISFYTFQAAGYLIDVYSGKVTAERSVFRFALFVGFFPQLVQGPISRHSDIANDLYAGHGWDYERARHGVQRIILGYFMKMLIADYAAVPVDEVFKNFTSYGGAVIIAALFFYSIQIYADFAGGINIAIGISEIIGIKPPENFRQPYFANSVSDFWRRWHITLGTWLKDYLFFPLALSKPFLKLGQFSRKRLGANYGKLVPSVLATFVVYGVVGIWHGSSLKYAAFGLYNGGIIAFSLFFEPLIAKLRAKTGIYGNKAGFGKAFAITRTFLLVLFSQYFARGASLMTALRMIKRTLFHFSPHEIWNGTLLNLGLKPMDYAVFSLAAAILLLYDIIAERGAPPLERLNRSKAPSQVVTLVLIIGVIVIFGIYREGYVASEFIYANF